MQNESKALDLARKLKALAERGIGGEKINAQKQLEKILKKHNLSMSTLEEETLVSGYFKITPTLKSLFGQIVASVILGGTSVYGSTRRKGYVYIEATPAQIAEIDMKMNFYGTLYEQESELFRTAFIEANRLFHPDAPHQDPKELIPKEQEKAERILRMAKQVKKATPFLELDKART